MVARLLAAGANPNFVAGNGQFPLLQAAGNGHAEAAALLLATGADPIQFDKKEGVFPLFMAAQEGHTDVVALLLESGADPYQVTLGSEASPLLPAAQKGWTKIVVPFARSECRS